MSETALLFGRSKSLVGILTDPRPGGTQPDRPGVVLLNAGVLHRVGPNRLYVQFARALAEAGFVVLRFDLSGIGDSRPREGSEAFASAVVEEVSSALDLLEASRGLRQFLLVGICSGADNGLRSASHDPRVVGAALIDGYNLGSLGFTLELYRGRFLSQQGWARLFSGRSELWSNLWRFLTSPRTERPTRTQSAPVLPAPPDYLRELRTLAERGVHLLLVYTGGSPALFNYRRLVRKSLRSWPSRERVEVELLEDSDHTFTLLCNQQRLVKRVCAWASARSGAVAAPGEATPTGSAPSVAATGPPSR
jgi:pimeloyl-ACP methyl ester carboxylesterase